MFFPLMLVPLLLLPMLACDPCDSAGSECTSKDTATNNDDSVRDSQGGDDSDSADSGGDTGHTPAILTVCLDSGDFTDIQSAIDASGPGDEIQVCPGIWSGLLEFRDQELTVVGEAGAVLDGDVDGADGALVRVVGRRSSVVLRGFDIADATPMFGDATAVQVSEGQLVIEGCIIRGADGDAMPTILVEQGGSLSMSDSEVRESHNTGALIQVFAADASFERTLIHDNWASYALEVSGSASVTLTNVGFWDNRYDGIHILAPAVVDAVNIVIYASGNGNANATILDESSGSRFRNSVVAAGGSREAAISYGSGSYEYIDLYGQSPRWERTNGSANTGNISADPMFNDPGAGDFGLPEGSPCIDAGDPDAAYNDIDGTRNDLGPTGGPGGGG